jgi:hypothetical protein
MEREHWTGDEVAKLRKLGIDPVKNRLEKLIPVVEHFLKGLSVWAITQAGAGDLRISGNLARKVRDGVASGDLDFIVQLIRKPPPPEATAIRDESSEAVRMTQMADMGRHFQEIREFTETVKKSLEIHELRLVGLRPSGPESMGRLGGDVRVERRSRLENRPLYLALRQHVKDEKLGGLLDEHDRLMKRISAATGALVVEAEDWVRTQGLSIISPQDVKIEKVGVLQEFGATAVVNALKDFRHGVWTEMPYVIQSNASVEMQISQSRGEAASRDYERAAFHRNLADGEMEEVFWWCVMRWTDESASVRIGAGQGGDLVQFRRAHIELRKQLSKRPDLSALVDMLRSRERLCSRIAAELDRLKHVVAIPGSCDLCATPPLDS